MTNNDFGELVRTILSEDWESFDRRNRELDEAGAWDGWAEYLGAAFFLAIDRRFSQDTDTSTIIKFVAETREQFDRSGADIDPVAAERLIRQALGRADASPLDDRTIAQTETILLLKLLRDMSPDELQLDAFLEDVEQLAERWRTK